MNKRTPPPSIAKGVELLDRVYPGWVEEINVGKLNLNSLDNCVLGQLYGNFSVGLSKAVFPNTPRGSTAAYGFIAPTVGLGRALTKDWKTYIRACRGERTLMQKITDWFYRW